MLIYATSNRRHLLPEYFSENAETRHVGEEVHPGESVEEKISLSERFGLWVSFYPFSQDEYFAAVKGWLGALRFCRRRVRRVARGSGAVVAVARVALGTDRVAVRARLRGPRALRVTRVTLSDARKSTAARAGSQ